MATYEKSVNQYYDLTTDAYRLYYGEHFLDLTRNRGHLGG
jgi:hypothetical protein